MPTRLAQSIKNMKLPQDIKDLILEFMYSMELNERHERLMTELDVDIFFRYVMRIYEFVLNINIT